MPNIREVFLFHVGDCAPEFYIECRIAYWLWRTVPFALLFIGTLGNILNIFILSKPQLRRFSTGVYLLILAITELIFLWTSLLPDTIYSITFNRLEDQSEILCRMRWWSALTSGAWSVWILVLLTIERTLFTKAPMFSKVHLTPKCAAISAIVGLVIVAMVNSHVIFGFSLLRKAIEIEDIRMSGSGNSSGGNGLPCTYVSVEYRAFYQETWSVIMLVIYTLVPTVIIFTGNVNIALVLLLRKKRLSRVAPGNPGKDIAEERRKSSAKMLFLISFIFLITTMPYSIFFIIRGQTEEISERNVSRWQLVTVILNLLGWCNFTFNFFLYFVNGTLFKQEWRKLVDKTKDRLSKIFT